MAQMSFGLKAVNPFRPWDPVFDQRLPVVAAVVVSGSHRPEVADMNLSG